MKVAVICVVKNAERRIAEWIAYNLVIGFDSIILVDNASTDKTVEVARRFAPLYDVRIIDWPMTGPFYQIKGFEYSLWSVRDEFDWCACFDADEFFADDNGRSINDLLINISPEIAGVAFPWAIFGSSGLSEEPSSLITEAYIMRAEEGFGPNQHIKSIVRPNRVVSCVTPHFFNVSGHYATGSGAIIEEPSSVLQDFSFRYGKINHYFVQSRESWIAKLNRGYHDVTRQMSDFDVYDKNDILDESAKSRSGEVKSLIANLDSQKK